MKHIAFILALSFLVFLPSRSSGAEPVMQRRVAILVGPGGREMAEALVRVGHFAPVDVHLLLEPTPAELLDEVDAVGRSTTEDALILFHYSGQSDGQAVYPHGEALPITALRGRLSSMAAGERVEVFDECRGGDCYFASGLLGAADLNADGEVTLGEACDYASLRAVRGEHEQGGSDSPPPSNLDIQIWGTRDVVLTSLRESTAVGAKPAEWSAPRLSSLSLWSATPGQRWLLHMGIGIGTQYWPLANGGANAASGHYSDSVSFGAQLWYRITDRLSWNVPFPAFSYRFGNPGSVEVMPSMGLKLNSWSGSAGPSFGFSTDVNALIWTTPNQRITLGAGVYLPAYKDTVSPLIAGVGMGNDVDPSVRAGYSWTIDHVVTLHAELGYVQNYYRGTLSNAWVQPRGGVDIRMSPRASLNLGVLYSDEVRQNLGSYENFSLGTTISF